MSANRSSSYSVDPSNLHLKKELTQIKKAARVLRDPGTTSSWRSPLASSRSTSHYRNTSGYSVEEVIGSNVNGSNGHVNSANRRKEKEKEKEKKVFLYNWRTQRSESERSVSVRHQQRRRSDGEESVDDSLSDARNDGDLNTTTPPPIRRMMMKKKKPIRKMVHSSSAAALKLELQRQLSLVDQYDSDDMVAVKGGSVTSPLLSRLKSAKLLKGGSRKDDSSSYCYSTPALSTSSINKRWVRNPSTVGSWDATTIDGDDEGMDDDQLGLPGRQGCGISCYWSSSKRSTPKRGVCGSCYSPSFSDTLRRKGSSILCGSGTQTNYRHRRRQRSSMGAYNKTHKTSHVPLLTNGVESRDRSDTGTDDELSTNYGELDLEALSRLDGRRWSTSHKSQEGLELVAVNGEIEEDSASSLDNINCFSYKYKPMFFEDIVGQNVVVQSLVNSVIKGRIAPVYLFQGPRGTGKTSTARIFAAALNCLATGDTRPCGVCRECAEFISGKSWVITEMDGSSKKGIEKVRFLMKKLQMGSSTSTFIRHEVFVIDECHLLPSKLWLAFQKFLEEPPQNVVFIFITTDLDNVPRAVLSRCQKYTFNKIKDSDIVNRLRKILEEENLDVESDALDLIALNVDGSLRDAETMLDQLSLLGKRITTDLVNELVGVVSDEKLLELVELAMSSNTAETVKRARELMDLGVDPMVLMSQMATLIMDIIAGTYQVVEARYGDSLFGGRSLTEGEVERLKQALKLLSDAEKQLRVSSERSTWFTATLLQLGSVQSADPTPSGSSRRQSSKTTDDDHPCAPATFKDIYFQKQKSTPIKPLLNNSTPQDALQSMRQLINDDGPSVSHHDDVTHGNTNSNILDEIWGRCIDKCHSKTLRQLLHTYGNLVSISEDKDNLVAYIVFRDKDIKSRAERFLSSITNSFETVLRRNIEVRLILLSDDDEPTANKDGPVDNFSDPKGRKVGNPVQRIESIIHEQRLETAWLQTAEKGTPGSLNRLRPERNQVLPQMETSQQQWEDELTRELNLLKINDGKKENTTITPSLLHDANLVTKDSMGYESGSGGGGGCFCFNKTKRNRRGKMKPGTPVGPRRGARFLIFGECGKSGRTEHRSRR
ncbi:putative DNA-directed DNA polymerase [Helianthus annuus]|uniref:DNA-directed DNA polymerase n=1 Tax=Helianthus annuus TaxID=4232 RepID=A0A251SPT3_HELAN|nr:protein STICHEL [Helianthus annuus]KAF5809985.1 putative DNA-directed DNA polymerase [Helianthus annuus]KAJ0588625.1 putative DNA-directed DNA polymerase [Helianthus annuus]KAJ0761202.1 putative DNA-directed DNA polymerase [Helianthus annuus]KAJ0926650.1 putative DNA-directed DNA polymerase [Helianthus annuus]KAJ0931129.1 putative DNA-directed DNA polymerase [Helianthus annuus]